jgi:hypothetical protein
MVGRYDSSVVQGIQTVRERAAITDLLVPGGLIKTPGRQLGTFCPPVGVLLLQKEGMRGDL